MNNQQLEGELKKVQEDLKITKGCLITLISYLSGEIGYDSARKLIDDINKEVNL